MFVQMWVVLSGRWGDRNGMEFGGWIVFAQAACNGLTESLFQPGPGLVRNIEGASFFDAGLQFCAVASRDELQLLLAESGQ